MYLIFVPSGMETKQALDRLKYEKQLWAENYKKIMGLDEVGRGCLAGPVVAAGVIFAPNVAINGIRDSKTIPLKERLELANAIKEKALFWTVQEGSIDLIAQRNILWASIETMRRCTEVKGASPDYLLVDGNRYTASIIPHKCVVKGDDKSISIAAASILAKVYRDELMERLGNEFSEFNWKKNVGYPTPEHKRALIEHGYTKHHRLGFKLGTEKRYSKRS